MPTQTQSASSPATGGDHLDVHKLGCIRLRMSDPGPLRSGYERRSGRRSVDPPPRSRSAPTGFAAARAQCASWSEGVGSCLAPGPGIKVVGVSLTVDDGWVVSAIASGSASAQIVDGAVEIGHGRSNRSLQDLPAQGKPVTVKLLLSRWRCTHETCLRRTFPTPATGGCRSTCASDDKGS